MLRKQPYALVTGLLVFLGMLLSSALPSGAATWYVIPSGGQGSCSQNPNSPQNGIIEGIGCLSSGDTLIAKSGVYNAAIDYRYITIPNGTSGAPTTLRSEVIRGAILRPTMAVTDPNFINIISLPANAHDVVIDGLVADAVNLTRASCGACTLSGVHDLVFTNLELMNGLDNHTLSGSAGFSTGQNSYNITLSNSKIHHYGGPPGSCNTNGYNPDDPSQVFCAAYGMYVQQTNSLVENNDIHDNAGYGIHNYASDDNSSNNIYRNNLIHNNGSTGFLFAAGGRNNKAYNNVLWGNGFNTSGYPALQVGGVGAPSSGNELYHNTIAHNVHTGLQLGAGGGPSGTIVRNNILYGNANDNVVEINTSGTVKSNNIEGSPDPRFANAGAGDFHLQSDSPAINAGTTIGLVTMDFECTPRPQGGSYDIGADELGPPGTGCVSTIVPDQLPPPTNFHLLAVTP